MSAEFSHVLALDQISDIAQIIDIAATPAQCTVIAERLQLPGIDQLSATLEVCTGLQGISVRGQLAAQFAYACRVTREPFAARLGEPIDVIFTDGELPDPASDDFVSGVELLALDPRGIDLAELLVESFALALDPYPRGPDADAALVELGILTEEQAIVQASPFAQLQGKV